MYLPAEPTYDSRRGGHLPRIVVVMVMVVPGLWMVFVPRSGERLVAAGEAECPISQRFVTVELLRLPVAAVVVLTVVQELLDLLPVVELQRSLLPVPARLLRIAELALNRLSALPALQELLKLPHTGVAAFIAIVVKPNALRAVIRLMVAARVAAVVAAARGEAAARLRKCRLRGRNDEQCNNCCRQNKA